MPFNMCTSGAIWTKAGTNVNPNVSGARLLIAANNAEAIINARTRINYSDTTAALNADVQGLLAQACSSLAAIDMVEYDMSGYTNRAEAETMLDVLNNQANQALSLLKDKKVTDFVDGA